MEKLKKVVILDRIKKAYGFKTDTQLANFLGIKPTHLAVWRARNSINLDLIITKCSKINLNWLFTGEGKPFEEEQKNNFVNEIEQSYLNNENEVLKLKKEIERLKSELKKMEQIDNQDAANLQNLKHQIRKLELENSELIGQNRILKELLNKKLGLNGA